MRKCISIFIYFCALGMVKQTLCEDVEEPINRMVISNSMADEKWAKEAIRDIAYYLRSYKFNEWDRRYYETKPVDINLFGYYRAFPEPTLRTLNWKVYEHCHSNFYTCIAYLREIIETAPITRKDDTNTILNEHNVPMNKTLRNYLDLECRKGLENSEVTGLPFDGPLEKFQWRTTAAYYMCWYTMLEIPVLSNLEENCDNFAYCLDPDIGPNNKDPRAEDGVPFKCATYSFCPDVCCPIKLVKDLTSCYFINPCYSENSLHKNRQACIFDRKNNKNFRDITLNKWNVSCNCEKEGFIWKSQYGMCVDIDECVTGEHTCNLKTEDCMNLPGSYTCICAWDYYWESSKSKCIHKPVVQLSKFVISEHFNGLNRFTNKIFRFFGF